MRINVDLPDLAALTELANRGSFTEAAQRLAVTPSALSRRIAKVEQAIGGRLVERTTRSFGLTPLGQRLVERIAPLLEMLDGCLRDAADEASGRFGRLSIGCAPTLAQSVLPAALRQFHSRYPEVRISLQDSHGANVRQAVLEREVEFGLAPLWQLNDELVAEPVTKDAYQLICPAEHPLARRQAVSWRELAPWKVLSFNPGSATRQQIDGILAAEGIELPWFDEVESLSTLMGHMEGGNTVTVLPALTITANSRLTHVPIEAPRIERTIYLFRRRDVTPSLPGQHLWDVLSQMLREPRRMDTR
ncbi:LysR family transcriptional regulator [Achromobacter aegrifaciens]